MRASLTSCNLFVKSNYFFLRPSENDPIYMIDAEKFVGFTIIKVEICQQNYFIKSNFRWL